VCRRILAKDVRISLFIFMELSGCFDVSRRREDMSGCDDTG